VPTEEMYRVFNMGIGMIVIAAPEDAQAVQDSIAEETYLVGQLVAGEKKVILQ